MRKKMYLLMVVVLALTTLLAACGGGKNGETQKQTQAGDGAKAETGEVQTPASKEDIDPLGKYDETITMSFFAQKDDSVKFNEGESWEDNLWSRHYLDKLNIQVQDKWIVDASQYDQQVAMSITSRDLADVMAFKVGDKNLQTLYENDQLADLS